MAKIEQIKKTAPLIAREITFGQNVRKLVFGVDFLDLNFSVQINPVWATNLDNSVGP